MGMNGIMLNLRKRSAVCPSPPMSRSEAQIALNLKGQANFRDRYLKPALELELVEMTVPDKPRSSKQKYHLTDKGKEWVEQNQAEK